MSADYDTLQLEHEKSQDNEKRAVLDLERARNELNNITLQHNDTLQQVRVCFFRVLRGTFSMMMFMIVFTRDNYLRCCNHNNFSVSDRNVFSQLLNQSKTSHTPQATNDNNNLRRELQDLRSKHKITLEARTRMEMELVNLRNDIGRHEMDTHKLNIVLKEQESSVVSLQENVNVLTAQLSNTNESVGRYKNVVAELEDGMQRKVSIGCALYFFLACVSVCVCVCLCVCLCLCVWLCVSDGQRIKHTVLYLTLLATRLVRTERHD